MINIKDLKTTDTELEELNLLSNSEDYLKELSEQEEVNIYGGCTCVAISNGLIVCQ